MSKISHPFTLLMFSVACISLTAGALLLDKSPVNSFGLGVASSFTAGAIIIILKKVSIDSILKRKSILSEQLFLVIKMAMNLSLQLTDTSQNVDQKTEPPIIAEFLVGLCAKRRYRNGLLQSLEDDFKGDLAAGTTVRRARWNYWAAALRSICPQLFAAAKRIGIIGLIADYTRRLLH